MQIIYHRIFLNHDTGNHPENKRRLECLGNLPETEIPDAVSDLTLYHTPEYIDQVKSACQNGTPLDPETLTSRDSYTAAVAAVGAAILASQTGNFALVRPPGHHARPDHAAGFCIFNNMAIAAQKLVNAGKKILIIDIDSHLGDGTAEFFYRTDRVMYCSLHQDRSFPGGGAVEDVGEAAGKGYTANIQLPAGSGDDIFLEGIKFAVRLGTQYQPDAVGISAGFDGHEHDGLLKLRLSAGAYYEAGKIISRNFPQAFAVLEGGYNPEYLPKCVYNFLSGVNGEPIKFPEDKTESTILTLEDFQLKLAKLKEQLSLYWQL